MKYYHIKIQTEWIMKKVDKYSGIMVYHKKDNWESYNLEVDTFAFKYKTIKVYKSKEELLENIPELMLV